MGPRWGWAGRQMGRLLEYRHKYYRNANRCRSVKGLVLDLRLGLRTQASHCEPSAHSNPKGGAPVTQDLLTNQSL